jgi:AcrR family transcriptional regulator
LYRHFPTKEALVGALMADRFTQITAFVREGLDDPDPWHGLTRSLWRGAELGAKDLALSQLFAEANIAAEHGGNDELHDAAAELIRRGQEAGAVRPDLVVDDIPVLMCGGMSSMHQTGGPGAWKRHLQIVIDGLRAGPGTTPLP